jgi:bifunctional non-homologous end joining protein LigD
VDRVLRFGKRSVTIEGAEQVLYPAARFTKEAVVDYYLAAAPFLLPHLRRRPAALKRYPEGIHGESFWEKDIPGFAPDWVKTVAVPRRDASAPPIRYVVIDDRATLAWVASVAGLEIHPFLHKVDALDTPTSVVFDLDPGEGSDILTCIDVAALLKDVLDRLHLAAFPKVSGSKGLQIHVPLNGDATYAVVQPFAKAVAELLAAEHPKLVVADMAKALRKGKVFIDWSQNADHKTTVAVYSLRAKRHRPYVCLPVTWDELDAASRRKDARSLDFTAPEAIVRMRERGDLAAPLLTLAQSLPAAFVSGLGTPPRRRRGLAAYEEKRRFAKTLEPAPEDMPVPQRSRQGSRRRFVIQKHAASHLHYDLRLESSEGALHSWSVPKGLPYAEGERRLAVNTEDHPIEYLTFEGVIPQGQYGGGTVMVWDIGHCEIIDGNYWKGRLRFHLRGRKLRGEWRLERDAARGERTWSLVKVGGAHKPPSAGREDSSALSGRTMSDIARARDAVWQSNRSTAPRAALRFVEPMHCKLVASLPEGDGWEYEIKYDGYRALGARTPDGVRLWSRRGNDLRARFPAVADALAQLPMDTMIDGEIVAIGSDGRPSFKLLHRTATPAERIHYYAFDILAHVGIDVTALPLAERRRLLEDALRHARAPLHRSAAIDAPAADLMAAAREQRLEGIVAKRRDGKYEPGERSGSWVKTRVSPGQELVVGGYIPGGDTFDALLVGYYAGARLVFIAKLRNGFVPATRREVMAKMRPIASERCPFANLPEPANARRGVALTADAMKRCRWVKPRLVVQVGFTEWTDNDHLRHARYLGLRDDKPAREVTHEAADP